ncbi:MAG: hypothetical protein MK033_04610 [Candidatus Caenarcaniphilales bacterium]|nr:hypothetical protein [Candidatus Caenarcaniphilales bacterium]
MAGINNNGNNKPGQPIGAAWKLNKASLNANKPKKTDSASQEPVNIRGSKESSNATNHGVVTKGLHVFQESVATHNLNQALKTIAKGNGHVSRQFEAIMGDGPEADKKFAAIEAKLKTSDAEQLGNVTSIRAEKVYPVDGQLDKPLSKLIELSARDRPTTGELIALFNSEDNSKDLPEAS